MHEGSILTVRRKKDLTFSSEECVALTLALELGRKLFRGDLPARDMSLHNRFCLLGRLELLLRNLIVVAH